MKELVNIMDTVKAIKTNLNTINIGRKQLITFCSIDVDRTIPEIHVYSGIYAIAELLGVTPEVKPRNSTQYSIEVSFTHDGVRFYSVCDSIEQLNKKGLRAI